MGWWCDGSRGGKEGRRESVEMRLGVKRMLIIQLLQLLIAIKRAILFYPSPAATVKAKVKAVAQVKHHPENSCVQSKGQAIHQISQQHPECGTVSLDLGFRFASCLTAMVDRVFTLSPFSS